MEGRPNAEADEETEDDDLDGGDDDARLPRLFGPAEVDVRERRNHQHGKEFLVEVQTKAECREVSEVQNFDEMDEEGAEGHSVERTCYCVGEPTHPPGIEAVRIDERLFHPEIATVCFRERRAEFRVRDGGEHRDEPVEDECDSERRTRDARRETGQGEHARTDHRADADERDIEEAHIPREFRFDPLRPVCSVFTDPSLGGSLGIRVYSAS